MQSVCMGAFSLYRCVVPPASIVALGQIEGFLMD